ncbi:MAG: glycosyltransferase family 4 protein [Synergistaceae bacterium]|jgi:glycosyltransferase involved in cell wall biosynthesis|nr:glycosyltransferase family 4 protein [Synergistaceae bacterium]
MKIMHILPELEEGGVERIVPVLAKCQARLGHDVCVVSNGGKLESLLEPAVRNIKMPVHRKTPVVGVPCAFRIARMIRREGISIIHAHSRVPAWICCTVKYLEPRVRYIFTAHANYPRLYYGTWPITKTDGITCVSGTALASLANWLPRHIPARVIYNPRNPHTLPWTGSGNQAVKHLLYLGRISEKKGPVFLVEALARTKNTNWTLDVIGDGPAMNLLREKITEFGMEDRVKIHGFSDEAPAAMSRCDLFLCPSREEGFSLTLKEALSSGTPVLASDIPAARELTSADGSNPNGELLSPVDAAAWADAIDRFIDGKMTPKLKLSIDLPTADEMASAMIEFYGEIMG